MDGMGMGWGAMALLFDIDFAQFWFRSWHFLRFLFVSCYARLLGEGDVVYRWLLTEEREWRYTGGDSDDGRSG